MAPTGTGNQAQYHSTLSDGVVTIGLMLNSPGGLRQLPRGVGVERKSVTQKDWSSGRGNKLFSKDTARYYDSGSAWTMTPDYLISGPLHTYANKGYRTTAHAQPGSVRWTALTSTRLYIARSFTVDTSFDADKATIWLRRIGSPGTLTLELCADSSGAPGTVLATATVTTSTITDWLHVRHAFDWSSVYTLATATTYWLKVYDAAGTTANHWEIGTDPATSGSKSANGSSWSSDTAAGLYYRIVPVSTAPDSLHFFEYKRLLYAATKPGTGASALYKNGDTGVTTGVVGTTSLQDTSKAWTTDEWVGCVLLITAGTGAGQARKISSNNSNTLTLDAAWNTTPVTASSEYVILGSSKWTAITITLAAPVTDVTVCNGIVYFAMGDSQNIRRWRAYNNAGTWTEQEADDGTNKAVHLLTMLDSTGALVVFRANNDTVKISKASAQTWGTDLTFGTAASVGDTDAPITSLAAYNSLIYIGKEDSIWSATTGASIIAEPVNPALKPVRDERNCLNMTGWNTFLYFTFQSGFERLTAGTVTTIDDIGPNRDAGMPSGRNEGYVADFVPILQRGYAAWDGGDSGYSCVLVTTAPGGDWHEIYRAAAAGARIKALHYQNVPLLVNRLWVAEGADIGYITVPDDPHSPLADANMKYTAESYVTTGWIDLDSPELDHYFDDLRLFSENLTVSGFRSVAVDYQVDGDGDTSSWVRFEQDYYTSPFQTINVGDSDVTGWRVRLRLRLLTGAVDTPVALSAMELRANSVNEPLYDYVIDITTEDRMALLNTSDSTRAAMNTVNQLLQWQARATPLTFRSVFDAFDNSTGHIDPVALVPVEHDTAGQLLSGSLTFKVTDKTIACETIVAGDTVTVVASDAHDVSSCLIVDGALVIVGSVSVT